MAKSITVRELLVRIGIEADDKALKAFDDGLTGVKTGMGKVVKGGAQLVGILGAITGALVGVTLATASAGDAAAKGGQRVGVTAEEYQELAVAADKSAASVQDLEAALKQQGIRAGVARAGNKEQLDAFRKFAGGLDDANGKAKTQIELFEDAADGISKLTSEQEQLDAANRLFSESGVKLLPLLKLGGDGIRRLREEARTTGQVLSNEAARDAEVFNDSLTDLTGIMLGVRNTIGVALLPTFAKLVTGTRDWFLANQKLINQKIEVWAKRAGRAIARIGPILKTVDRLVQNTIGTWSPIIVGVGLALAGLILAIPVVTILSGVVITLAGALAILQAAAAPIAAFFGVPMLLVLAAAAAAFLSVVAPLVVLGAAIVTVLLVMEELMVIARGGKTVIGTLTGTLREMGGVWGDIADIIDIVVKNAVDMLTTFKAFATVISVLVTEGLPVLLKLLKGVGKSFGDWLADMVKGNPVLKSIFDALKKLDEVVFDGLTKGLRGVLDLVESIFTFVGSGARNFNTAFGGVESLADLQKGTSVLGSLNAQSSGALTSGVRSALGFAPSSGRSGGKGKNNVTVQQNTTITIPDAGSPEATAAAVIAKQQELMRAAQDAFKGGEL